MVPSIVPPLVKFIALRSPLGMQTVCGMQPRRDAGGGALRECSLPDRGAQPRTGENADHMLTREASVTTAPRRPAT